ncbi:hypothetical protein PMAYCL1PPCAC_26873 [Pristionchus mayeri]|uniref:Uncharacterized protein n=1 Tax=Pristionchus mayeri TaxID=1317129 RepID=A0AAN5D528_9BILA|nr:hypothetical protein PMAYCL1PPCAC_26873 [Pristionchus mayeri]
MRNREAPTGKPSGQGCDEYRSILPPPSLPVTRPQPAPPLAIHARVSRVACSSCSPSARLRPASCRKRSKNVRFPPHHLSQGSRSARRHVLRLDHPPQLRLRHHRVPALRCPSRRHRDPPRIHRLRCLVRLRGLRPLAPRPQTRPEVPDRHPPRGRVRRPQLRVPRLLSAHHHVYSSHRLRSQPRIQLRGSHTRQLRVYPIPSTLP